MGKKKQKAVRESFNFTQEDRDFLDSYLELFKRRAADLDVIRGMLASADRWGDEPGLIVTDFNKVWFSYALRGLADTLQGIRACLRDELADYIDKDTGTSYIKDLDTLLDGISELIDACHECDCELPMFFTPGG